MHVVVCATKMHSSLCHMLWLNTASPWHFRCWGCVRRKLGVGAKTVVRIGTGIQWHVASVPGVDVANQTRSAVIASQLEPTRYLMALLIDSHTDLC